MIVTKSPLELEGKVLIDSDGLIWRLNPKISKKLWGLYKSREWEFVRDGLNMEVAMRDLSANSASGMLSSWQINIAQPLVNDFAKSAAPIFEKCIATGEKTFRRELLNALGTQGEKMFGNFIAEKFEKIGEIYEQEKKSESEKVFQTDGPFPLSARFRWQLLTRKNTYTVFCLEFPPQHRNIYLWNEQRRVVFPWVYFLVCFLNGDLYEKGFVGAGGDHALCWVSVFYSPKQLKKQSETLYLSNLPEAYADFPFGSCLGAGRPPIKLSDPNWSQVLIDWFWGSNFYSGHPWTTELFLRVANLIPELKNAEEWERFSQNKDCLVTVCKLPWIETGYNLGEMVKAMLDYMAKNHEDLKESVNEKRKNQLQVIASQFREQLEEKILFLGAHFSVPKEILQETKEFLSARLSEVTSKLSASLANRCKQLGKDFGKRFTTELQQIKGGE